MRRLLYFAMSCLLFGALVPVPAQASTGSCSVSPNPDPVGTDYTIAGSGLQPASTYVVHLTEPQQSTEQHKLDALATTDATGAFSLTEGYGGPRGIWTPGTVSVAVALSSGRGYNHTGKAASCSFQVVSALALLTSPSPVVVILMENKSFTSITSTNKALLPYINQTLIPGGLEFTDYHAIEHPSLPNYLDITSGANDGCVNSDACAPDSITVNNIFHQLTANAMTVGSFEESMPKNCDQVTHSTDSLYWRKHNPEVFYTDTQAACATDNVPYSALNLTNLPAFSFVTPNICHDMHGNTNAGCPSGTNALLTAGDTWLKDNVPLFVNAGATVIVTWDESTGTGTQVLTVETGNAVTPGTNNTSFTHYSLLAGLETHYGVVKLQNAATANVLPIPA